MPGVPGYRILAEIASGASGTVYRAVQERLDRVVALKLLAARLFGEAETRARFVRESKVQARLVHAHLLGVYDAGFAGETPYLAMELVEGGSLRQHLARHGTLSLREAARIGEEVASGLAFAHAAGVVHRDLKPENVLLTTAGAAKVADFGLAKVSSTTATVQTSAGIILGTPGYIAPESIEGKPAGPPADVYALGVLLHEMISGALPFSGDAPLELMQSQLMQAPSPPGANRAGVPLELDELVERCMARNPGRRPTAAQVEQTLAELSERLPSAREPQRRQRQAPSAVRTRAAPGAPASRTAPAAGTVSVPGWPWRVLTGLVRGGGKTMAAESSIAAGQPNSGDGAAGGGPLSRWRGLAALACVGLAVVMARRTVPPASPPALSVAAVGCERVRLTFTPPAAGDFELACFPAGDQTTSRSVRVVSGAPGALVDGLRPGTEYVVRWPGAAGVPFRTLLALDGSDTPLLNRPGEGWQLEVAATAGSIGASWLTTAEGSQFLNVIQFSESRDRGLTWSPPVAINPIPTWWGVYTLGGGADGFTAVWRQKRDGAPAKLQSAVRTVDSTRFEPVGAVESGSCDHGIDMLPGGQIVACPPSGAEPHPIGLTRAHRASLEPIRPLGLTVPRDVGVLGLVPDEPEPLLTFGPKLKDVPGEALWAGPADASWRKVAEAPPRSSPRYRIVGDSASGTEFLACDLGDAILFYLKDAKAQAFERVDVRPLAIPETTAGSQLLAWTQFTMRAPAVLAREGGFILACFSKGLSLAPGKLRNSWVLRVLRSPNGRSWAEYHQRTLDMPTPREFRLVPAGDRLLGIVLTTSGLAIALPVPG